jgi:uncharacterized protein (TIGR02145 family)
MRKIIYTCLFFIIPSSLLWGQTYTTGSFTDTRDGQTYKTVKIGNQVWMSQNLNYAIAEDSWTLPNDSDGKKYGRFYTWESAKKAVPTGWHLPTKEEFETLAANLGVDELPNWDQLYTLLIEGGATGFNAQLTGSHNNGYGKQGQTASFWSSEESTFSRIMPFWETPWRLSFRSPNYVNIGQGADSIEGFNVRCIRD